MKKLTFFFALLIGSTMMIQAQNTIHQTQNLNLHPQGDEVSLSAFMVNEEKILVQWKTDIQGIYFEIEKSIDGENYEMIATIEDVVSSPDNTTFQFVDETPLLENYYRIFYITPSGVVDYSDETFISPLPSNMTLDGLK